MFMALSILHAIFFIVLQLIFLDVVRGEDPTLHNNTTNYVPPWTSGRSKRSLQNMPNILKIQIKYSTDELINLKWIKQSSLIANNYLPVITLSGSPSTNLMEDVGAFVVYYDLEKCSSIVYFEKMNAVVGYVGSVYFITYLPYEFDENGNYPVVVGEPYVIKRNNAPAHNLPPLPNMDHVQTNIIQPSNDDSIGGIIRTLHSDPGPSSKHHRNDRDINEENYAQMMNVSELNIHNIRKRRGNPSDYEYYLEILVFVTHDTAEKIKSISEENHISWIVRYCIAHFSAVDMIFTKMRKYNLMMHINIAKIVIANDLESFQFNINGEFQFTEAVANLRKYLHAHHDVYLPDSFDHIFVITSLPITEGSSVIPGMSEYHTDLYEERKKNQFYNAVPITVVGHETDYAVAVHEIGCTLNLKTDSKQCSGIMHEGNSYCNNCLRWSDDSRDQFQVFLSENRHRCFLLNYPRSLRPPGPSVFLSPSKQCICFGYLPYVTKTSSTIRAYIRVNECNVPLQCKKNDGDRSYFEDTARPFDGTSCGNRGKVCWGGECVSFKSAICTS